MPLTPAEINSKDFLVSLRGYDREEVRAFLAAIAADYKSALAAATQAETGATSYEQLGGEVGRVLEAARDAAEEMHRRAEEETEALRRNVSEEAENLLSAATMAAAQLKEEAEKLASEVRSQAGRHDVTVRAEADRYSEQVRKDAKREAQEVTKTAAQRVQRLRAAEMRIRGGFSAIEALIREARDDVLSDEPQSGTSELEGQLESDSGASVAASKSASKSASSPISPGAR